MQDDTDTAFDLETDRYICKSCKLLRLFKYEWTYGRVIFPKGNFSVIRVNCGNCNTTHDYEISEIISGRSSPDDSKADKRLIEKLERELKEKNTEIERLRTDNHKLTNAIAVLTTKLDENSAKTDRPERNPLSS